MSAEQTTPSHAAVDRVVAALEAQGVEPRVVWFGDAVTTVAPGDRVVLAWRAPCGTCRAC